MSNPTYATRSYTIAIGGALEVFRTASFISCLEATHAFELKFNNGPKSDFEAGLTYTPSNDFERVQIINPSATDILVVKMAFGRGNIRDARLTLSGQIDTRTDVPDVLTTIAPVSAVDAATTPILAANTLRKEAILSNEGAGKIYIGGAAGAVAGQGVPVDVGGVFILTTTAAIYARNDTGAAVNVGVTETEFSA